MKVYLKGGLGNQLFQFCYLHFLYSSLDLKCGIFKDSNPREDRPYLLDNLLQFCNHAKTDSKMNLIAAKILGRFLNLKLINGLAYRLHRSKLVFESQEYVFPPKLATLKKNGIAVGYYQHWKYVEKSWETLGPELNKCLKLYSLPPSYSNEYVVIHIRRGDFALQSEQLGILQKDYYERAIQAVLSTLHISSVKIYVITDEIETAMKICNESFDAEIIGPEILDEWRCLSLMSGAQAVITANSTLSWWGGFLCHKNGGLMVIPEPWFDGWAERVGSAFASPGVLQVDSGFRGLKT